MEVAEQQNCEYVPSSSYTTLFAPLVWLLLAVKHEQDGLTSCLLRSFRCGQLRLARLHRKG